MFGSTALPRTLPAALRDVTSTKAAVRIEAIQQLAPYIEQDRERIIVALGVALRDEVVGVRAAAATTLGELGVHEALPQLLVALEDEHAYGRQMAILALGEIGDPRATERLRRALSDPRADVRFQAVMAFSRVCKDAEDVERALLAATHDDDAFVAHIALRMAEEVGADSPLSPRVVKRAEAMLAHESGMVRVASAIIVARWGEAKKAQPVLAALVDGATTTQDQEDLAIAIELCGELGIDAARSGLERRAFGGTLRRDRFRWHARTALAQMGHERARREIIRELGSWQRDKRTLAVAAAGRARIAEARALILSMQGDDSRADPNAVREALAAIDGTLEASEAASC